MSKLQRKHRFHVSGSTVVARPARMVATGFAITILIGGLLLASPLSSSSGQRTPFIDALFTATSAVCVTGLAVLDTATHFSVFGKIVIIALIQAGGLGIMLVASLFSLSILGKLSLRAKITAQTEAKAVEGPNVKNAALSIVKVTFTIEGIIAVLLAARFILGYGYSFGEGLAYGGFHAISAFNNAGFALFSDNLVGFASDPWICIPIAAAIILGGLGFPVILQIRRYARNRLKWSMNTKIVLVGTVALLLLGTVFITAMEWANPDTLGPMSVQDKLLAGFFQSVQTRTAGFNSINIGDMHSATWLGMDLLMFIGAGPAGTGGGIKITTFAVLFFIILTELRGEAAVNIFGKRLSRSVHRQAITVALVAVAAVFTGTMALLVITEFTLDECLFEATSAFATVGLSTGITPELPATGEAVLIALMYLGRVGVLSLGSALALRDKKAVFELPKERPAIG